MNNPPYILTDVFADVVSKVSAKLNTDSILQKPINYQYGYVTELNETLKQYEKDREKSELKFPLIWLAQPFTISMGEIGWYGKTNNLALFIIHSTEKTFKAEERMTNVFKPVIYPIYNELLNQIFKHPAFGAKSIDQIKHKATDFYYWGENKKSVLNDIVDCMQISNLELKINNKQNCPPRVKQLIH